MGSPNLNLSTYTNFAQDVHDCPLQGESEIPQSESQYNTITLQTVSEIPQSENQYNVTDSPAQQRSDILPSEDQYIIYKELQERVKGPGRIIPVKCDVGRPEDLARLVATAAATGGVDVLVNNAALLHNGTVSDYKASGSSLEDIEQCWNVNVMAVVRATRLAVADMARRRAPGAIIMINRCSSFEFILTMLERERDGGGEGDAAGRRGHGAAARARRHHHDQQVLFF
ncbi:hypothetical protein EVAR_43746_1 [Eumeta japonica]|uniref:Dehydrogenase/reductase SDR family member 11 n=1 Tax=Eumeta variegata TaxID=151549 RepID=A0A4C1Y0U3_EUMVA|nr:hypothetical protein EVAR_43746_1 [Eumeta japonica]